MTEFDKHAAQLQELESLRSRLEEAEETLRAIRSGEVDALVVDTGEGEQIFTLKTAETAYRVAIESINEGVLTLSTDGLIIYANSAMGYLLNTPLELLTGVCIFDFTDGANAETLASMLQNGSGRHEISFKATQGITIPALVSIVALPVTSSPTLTLVAVVTNLTELKRRDEVIAQGKLLRESEARFRLATSAAHAMVYDIDTRTLHINAMDGLREVLGYEEDEAEATLDWWNRGIHPDDLPKCKAAFERMHATGQGHKIEYRVYHKDGRLLHVEDNASAVRNEAGQLVRVVGTVVDITERKEAEGALRESEERLRSLTENVPCVLMRFDRQLRVVYLSKQSDRYNPNPVEQMTGRTNREMGMPEHLCDLWDAAIEMVFNTGLPEEVEFDLAGPSGMRTFTLKLAPEFSPNHEIHSVLGVSTDITDRKKMEEALAQAKENLEILVEERTHELWAQVETTKHAEAELRALSVKMILAQEEERRGIAKELHDEIGQTLTVLKLMAGGLSKTIPGEFKPKVEAISKELTDVMSHVRLMSQSLRPTVLDDLGLVPGLEWLFARLKEQAGLQIEFDCPKLDGLKQNVSITAYRIIQESLTNVMRHSGVKSAFVHVSTDENELRIRVTDYGRGFNQLELQTSTGLSAMRERAKLVGGKVEFESAPGKGTVVTAVIPLQ